MEPQNFVADCRAPQNFVADPIALYHKYLWQKARNFTTNVFGRIAFVWRHGTAQPKFVSYHQILWQTAPKSVFGRCHCTAPQKPRPHCTAQQRHSPAQQPSVFGCHHLSAAPKLWCRADVTKNIVTDFTTAQCMVTDPNAPYHKILYHTDHNFNTNIFGRPHYTAPNSVFRRCAPQKPRQ